MTLDVNVQLIDFKTAKGHEMVIPNEDGSYTILINTRMTREAQMVAYSHAIDHILRNDFEKDDVQKIEHHAHK